MIRTTGFGTNVGKSFLVALSCRLFKEEVYKVAPYKSLNLTPVTYLKDRKEFRYAHVLQAKDGEEEPDYKR